MFQRLIAFFFVFQLGLFAQAKTWIDRSHEIFLPPQVNSQLAAYRDFPMFWWNFLVLEYSGEPPWETAGKICRQVTEEGADNVAKSACPENLANFQAFAQDWIQDQTLREPAPSVAELRARMAETLAKASMVPDRSVLQMLRMDPMGSLNSLMVRAEKLSPLKMENYQGLFLDREHSLILIPVQFNVSPSEAGKLASLFSKIAGHCMKEENCQALNWIGPHASAVENEMRVHADIEAVTLVGIVLLVLLALIMWLTKKLRLLYLVPFLLLSVFIATVLTVFTFGSIHGIVLAFGPGIIGLAMDYGIHSAFMDPTSKKTWMANLLGILTTGIVLVVMFFSQIPLLKQLMFFSLTGLVLSYVFFYWIMNRYPSTFRLTPYPLHPERSKGMGALTLLLFLGCVTLPFMNFNWDLRQMNYESDRTHDLHNWVFRNSAARDSYFLMHPHATALSEAHQAKAFADKIKLPYQGIANDLPPPQEQEKNLASWKKIFCADSPLSLSENEKKFFDPYFALMACENLRTRDLDQPPAYIADMTARNQWISLFIPKSDGHKSDLYKAYPQASTASQVFMAIPDVLKKELLWMVPLSFLAAFGILFGYYRNLKKSFLAVIPFLTGLGTFCLMSFVFKVPVTFASFIGLVMVFGMSIDYGVFVVNFLGLKDPVANGVWSALSLSGYATVAGFLPLLFAHHPVLYQLGHALTWGAVGTYLGSVFGLPWLSNWWTANEK